MQKTQNKLNKRVENVKTSSDTKTKLLYIAPTFKLAVISLEICLSFFFSFFLVLLFSPYLLFKEKILL